MTEDITPDAQDLWEGIGGHFDSFSQIICEFIDNSLGNFVGNNSSTRNIEIVLEKNRDKIKVKIEDMGTGIKDIPRALKLGNRSIRESTFNEHGFGLKHALASANINNDNWKIYTRTIKDFKSNKYKLVQAPFKFNIEIKEVDISTTPWPGSFNGSGTLVEFSCVKELFFTLQRGIRGRANQFSTCLKYLVEDLGFIYSGIIKKGLLTITIRSGTNFREIVGSIEPDWIDFYKPGEGTTKLNLGNGEVTINYKFGEMNVSEYKKYYRRNMSTSGVEIRINGRVMMYNLFKEIWKIEKHNIYNHFLVIVDIVSDARNRLPKTRTSKNGIRTGDKKLEELFKWIKSTHPTPPKDLSEAINEKELVKELQKAKETHIRNPSKHIKIDFGVFRTINSQVKVDLYCFDGNNLYLYEAKKDKADIPSVYQLLMYWDGAVCDGRTPKEGILIAKEFTAGVDQIIVYINTLTDRDGNNYNLVKRTWLEENIKYPKI